MVEHGRCQTSLRVGKYRLKRPYHIQHKGNLNIRGNAYRLVVAADLEKGIVWIKWLGAHRDYDRIDVREIEVE